MVTDRRSARSRRSSQASFDFRPWGGARPGAGRKRRAPRPRVPHRPRVALAARFPVHVTVRLADGLPSLRRARTYAALEPALLAGSERFGFRLVEYSVQANHLHLVCEAKDRRALSCGMQGLLVRAARALNRCWRRCGTVFGDRYHDRVLRSPREVRHALAYVLHNARHHGASAPRDRPDPFSSGDGFAGWRSWLGRVLRRLPAARTWLLAVGWRRHGRIGLDETPVGSRRSARGSPRLPTSGRTTSPPP